MEFLADGFEVLWVLGGGFVAGVAGMLSKFTMDAYMFFIHDILLSRPSTTTAISDQSQYSHLPFPTQPSQQRQPASYQRGIHHS